MATKIGPNITSGTGDQTKVVGQKPSEPDSDGVHTVKELRELYEASKITGDDATFFEPKAGNETQAFCSPPKFIDCKPKVVYDRTEQT